jgi:hypothetical protein
VEGAKIAAGEELAAADRRDAFGTLELFDGFPDDETTQKVYDNLDFQLKETFI